MDDQDRLRIPMSEEELERIRKAAEANGLEIEEWARAELLRILRERDQQS